MATIDKTQSPYFDTFDRDDNYTQLLFNPDRPLQQRELNELQSALNQKIHALGDSLFKEGDIMSGLDFSLTRNTENDTVTVDIKQGFVFLNSEAHWTLGGSVTIPSTGRAYINAYIDETIVTSEQDAKLNDPTLGVPSSSAKGADRLKSEVVFVAYVPDSGISNDTTTGAEVYAFQDGNLNVVADKPGVSNIMDILATRTYETNGHYRVSGYDIVINPSQDDTDNVNFSITDGRAYVKGYRVQKESATSMSVPVSRDSRQVINEPALYNSATNKLEISQRPLKAVESVTASVLKTQAISRTNTLVDPFPAGSYGSGIVAIKSITSSKGTVYGTLDNPATSANPADITVSGGNSIAWASGSKVIPATGTSYQVTYLYTKIMEPNVDYRITVDNTATDENGFSRTYIDFSGMSGDKPTTLSGFSQVNTTYDFYLARRDLISLNAIGDFVVTTGTPDTIDKVQINNQSDDYTLPIGWVTVYPNATTASANPYTITNLTFRDLQKMLARVQNLEYNVGQMAQDITASTGQDPLKLRGVFSDGLSTIQQADEAIFGDDDNPWMENGKVVSEAAHSFSDATITLGYQNADYYDTPNIKSTTGTDNEFTKLMNWPGKMVSGTYKNVRELSQKVATGIMNVNPYAVYPTQDGKLTLSPAVDNHVDTKHMTVNNVKYKTLKVYRFWRHGGQNWTKDSQYVYDHLNNISWSDGTAGWAVGGGKTGAGAPSNYSGGWTGVMKGSIVESGGQKTEEEMKKYARSIEVTFSAKGLKPLDDNLRIYWDGNGQAGSMPLVTKPVSPSTAGSKAGTVRADASGAVKGKFTVPANQPQGKHSIILQTDTTGVASSSATATYTAASKDVTVTDIINTTFIQAKFVDPLAESFQFEGDRVLTGVQLYFQSKDSSVPVKVQIRPLADGGLPSSQVMGEALLNPSEVKTSNDGSVATMFSFDNPVLIESGVNYAFVVMSNSNNYNVFYAQMGQRKLGKDTSVLVSNPYGGTMFSSANAISWTVHQDADLKFDLFTAQFREGDSTILFDPWTPDKKDIGVLTIPTMTEAEKSNIKMEYRVVLESANSTATLDTAPWQPIDLNLDEIDLGGYIKQIQLRITFTASKYTSPFVTLDTVTLMGLLTDLNGTYVTKNIDLGDNGTFNTVQFSYQVHNESGTSVTPKLHIGQSDTALTWRTMDELKSLGATVTSVISQPNVNGFQTVSTTVRLSSSVPGVGTLGATLAKFRLDLHSDVSYIRPRVKQISVVLTDE